MRKPIVEGQRISETIYAFARSYDEDYLALEALHVIDKCWAIVEVAK